MPQRMLAIAPCFDVSHMHKHTHKHIKNYYNIAHAHWVLKLPNFQLYNSLYVIYATAVNEVSGRLQRQQVMVQGSNVKIIAKLLQGVS